VLSIGPNISGVQTVVKTGAQWDLLQEALNTVFISDSTGAITWDTENYIGTVHRDGLFSLYMNQGWAADTPRAITIGHRINGGGWSSRGTMTANSTAARILGSADVVYMSANDTIEFGFYGGAATYTSEYSALFKITIVYNAVEN